MKRFLLSDKPLNTSAYVDSMRNIECGGFVSFEGWVRDFNEGKKVSKLHYEAYQALAEKECDKIIAEAEEKFSIKNVMVVHRVGELSLGEIAVWIGAIGVHRGEAFDACEYVINELKVRVPIWKKEFYVDGDSGWVACHECMKHDHAHKEHHLH